jgi:phage FluMu protein Com
MQTVQLQCGSCSKLMAISVAHLGGQVQCPHCRAVVQAPAPTPPTRPQPAPAAPAPHVTERESIFSAPEPSDDLFGAGPSRPLVEMPPEPEREITATVDFAPAPERPPVAVTEPGEEPAPEPEPEDDESSLPTHRPRPLYDKSMGPLIALIFLVPYALLTTVFLAILWMQLRNQPHPLDMLPDPKPDKGGPRRVERIQHDYPVAAHQKVGLGATLRVGDIEVTPQRVEQNKEGDLVLRLKVKNVSDDQAFAPISDPFLHVQDRQGGKPYTFLQTDTLKPVYGGSLEIKRGEDRASDGELAPGQEETILLTTMDSDRSTTRKVAAGKDRLLWRVQLRRGLVTHRGKALSATTVVGVQLTPKDIARAP